MEPRVETAPPSVSENRNADEWHSALEGAGLPRPPPSPSRSELDELQRRSFVEDTQLASEVLRQRIRERREAQGLTQRQLAEAMTAAGVPLTPDKVSKVELGVRGVELDELLAFAYVLDLPLARLMSPHEGERPIRAGGIGLERHEVGNWMVWGPSWSREAMSAQTYMGLARRIWTMAQVVADERDPERRAEHARTLIGLVEELRKAAPVKPGVMKRQVLRDEMDGRRSTRPLS